LNTTRVRHPKVQNRSRAWPLAKSSQPLSHQTSGLGVTTG
jgi:hypothetical protein